MSQEIKITVGADRTFTWKSPTPLAIGQIPLLDLQHADVGTISPPLTAIAADGDVIAINRDKVTLTLSAPIANDDGIQGVLGEAWLITDEDGHYSVRVKRIDGTQVILAEPLPNLPSMTTAAVLQFRRWVATFSKADVTDASRRNWTCTVSYVSRYGADTPEVPLTDQSLLHVVRQPFSTGLTSEGLINWFPDLSDLVPGRQQDFQPQIDLALTLLIADIRERMRENTCSKYEDDVSGGTLQQCHAYLVASLLYEIRKPELSMMLRERYTTILDQSLAHVWVDCNGDGVPDDDENPGPVAVSVDYGNYFQVYGKDPVFKYDDVH